MLVLMWLCLSSGPRSIQAPLEQKLPTFDDAKELTTSGGLPLRIAAMILSSLIPPTTSTWTPGVFASYSAMSRLRTLSSWVDGRNPTQIVILTGFDEPVTAPATPAASARQATASSAAIRRLIGPPFGAGDSD